MDVATTLLMGLAAFVTLAIFVYIISVFGIKGKTFEEAIEEQRRKDRELLQEAKADKPKKEKKYKKLTKRATKPEKTTLEEELRPVSVDFKNETEIIPLEPDLETKPGKAKKKPKANPPPKSILLNKHEVGIVSEVVSLIESDDNAEVLIPAGSKVPKDEVERRNSLHSVDRLSIGDVETAEDSSSANASRPTNKSVLEVPQVVEAPDSRNVIREQSKSPEKEKVQKEEANLVAQVPTASLTNKKNKKLKQDSVELVDGDVSVKKLFTMLRNASLGGDELQMLIEVLLNKQQGEAAEWTKKNDPVATLKKQLQEKEQLLEEEKRMVQSLSSKTKELRQELNQEKSRFNSCERGAREKLLQQQQEIAALQTSIQRSRDQHQSEISVVQSKLQQLQHLKGEVNNLEKKISQLEAEKQSWLGLEIQLQRELEQLRTNREHAESSLASLEQEREALNQQVLCREAQVQELKEMEHHNASLAQELQRAKNTCNTLEGEKGSFQKRLETQEQQHRKMDEEMHKLTAVLRESQSKQQESERLAEQHLNLVKNAENKNNDLVQQVKELKVDVEGLSTQLLEARNQESLRNQQNGELSRDEEERRKIESLEHTNIIEEKERLLVQLRDEINGNKNLIVTLTDDLENQKQKNNELREKNWKAMEALSAAEVAAQKKVKEVEDRLAVVQEESKAKVAPNHLRTFEEKAQQAEKAHEALMQRIKDQEEKERELLQRLFPEIQLDSKTDQSTWMQSYEEHVCQFLNKLRHSSSTQQSNGAGDRNKHLEAMVQHYKNVLSDTEGMLKNLQNRVEATELDWREKLGAKEQELKKTLAEKEVLEASIKEHQSLDVATSEVRELQDKLKELQAKLQGEEHEKKLLEQKFEEVSKNAQDLKDQVEGRKLELEELTNEKTHFETTLKELEKIRSDLEKEKKITKDLSAHTVKLQSLVKIGQDSLKAEQDLVKSLQAQLELSTVATTNGSPATPAKTVPELDGALGKK